MSKYILIDNVDRNRDLQQYYCANIVEKTFECSNILTYKKGGGYGLNYRYCSFCYDKWNKQEDEARLKNMPSKKPVNKYRTQYDDIDFTD